MAKLILGNEVISGPAFHGDRDEECFVIVSDDGRVFVTKYSHYYDEEDSHHYVDYKWREVVVDRSSSDTPIPPHVIADMAFDSEFGKRGAHGRTTKLIVAPGSMRCGLWTNDGYDKHVAKKKNVA